MHAYITECTENAIIAEIATQPRAQMSFTADFTFKQFAIEHKNCAMKVNTDGILLASWVQLLHPKSILDIGTGSGLLSLMLAQRTQESGSQITALEIDEDASKQAQINFEQSPWHERINNVRADVTQWQCDTQFDVIISNPPYFTNSLASPNEKRHLARHNDSLSFIQLLDCASKLSTRNAELHLILPSNETQSLLSLLPQTNWHLIRHTSVSTVDGKVASRELLSFSKHAGNLIHNTLCIKTQSNQYSPEFIELTRAFYLFM
jgi:tRNA1Val (adenine37-N6)-methyltransferase